MREGNKRFYVAIFFGEFAESFARNQANFVTKRRKSCIGIVLSKQNSILGTRGKHAVRLINTLRHQVVDQHTDIGFVAIQYHGTLPYSTSVGIDTRHQTLRCGLLVAGRTIHLAGKVKTLDELCFERVKELSWRKIVVLDGVTRTVDVQIFEALDLVQSLPLHLPRQR